MEQERTLTITGRGTATATPDVAEITIGVRILAPTLPEAANKASADMARVMEVLRGQGLADADLKTTRFSVYTQERYQGPDNQRTSVTEYVATNGVRVTVRDLSAIGRTISAVIAAGAGEIYGLGFRLDDSEPLTRQARADAMRDAQTRANEYAQLAGVSLGAVRTISEDSYGLSGGSMAGPYGSGGLISLGGATGGLAAPPDTPVESGEVVATASVHIVWDLQ